jgi:uncharacterized protein (TIGR03086 family)
MTSTLERYDTAAAGFRARLAALRVEDLARPSPCDGWSAGDVVEHAVGVVVRTAAAVAPPPDVAGRGALERFDVASADLREKVADPVRAATVVPSPVGELAFKQLVSSIVVHDLLVHTWDLARATGGDERLDPALVAHTYATMLPFDAQLRGHGFADRVAVADDADDQTRLLAFLGRRP